MDPLAVPPCGDDAAAVRVRRRRAAGRSDRPVPRAGHRRAGRRRDGGRRRPVRVARRPGLGAQGVQHRARSGRRRRRPRLPGPLGRVVDHTWWHPAAPPWHRRARLARVVLDRQRRCVLVPHRGDRRRRGAPFGDRDPGGDPRGPARTRRAVPVGPAGLVVVPAPHAAPLRHRRLGRASHGARPLGGPRRHPPRRHRGAAFLTRRPAAGRALPAPLLGLPVRGAARVLDRW